MPVGFFFFKDAFSFSLSVSLSLSRLSLNLELSFLLKIFTMILAMGHLCVIPVLRWTVHRPFDLKICVFPLVHFIIS